MTIEEAFGITVRTLRKERNLSQEKLAFGAGLDRSFLSLLEGGRKQPSLLTIFQIAHALEVPPSAIIKAVEDKLGIA